MANEIEKKTDKAIFVGIIRQDDEERKVLEYLDELEFLAMTAGFEGGQLHQARHLRR